jgi:hypothetical protein
MPDNNGAVTTFAAAAATIVPSGGAVQREKRNGDPVSGREDYANPRKRARSTSPLADASELAESAAERMWPACRPVGGRTAATSERRTGCSEGRRALEYLGEDEVGCAEVSSDSEEEEEELPPGDRVAYIHVGEGGEADLEAQLKGMLQLHSAQGHRRVFLIGLVGELVNFGAVTDTQLNFICERPITVEYL